MNHLLNNVALVVLNDETDDVLAKVFGPASERVLALHRGPEIKAKDLLGWTAPPHGNHTFLHFVDAASGRPALRMIVRRPDQVRAMLLCAGRGDLAAQPLLDAVRL